MEIIEDAVTNVFEFNKYLIEIANFEKKSADESSEVRIAIGLNDDRTTLGNKFKSISPSISRLGDGMTS